MEKPNFKKMSYAELHKLTADLYGTNPQQRAEAEAELSRRQKNKDNLMIIMTFLILLLTAYLVIKDLLPDLKKKKNTAANKNTYEQQKPNPIHNQPPSKK